MDTDNNVFGYSGLYRLKSDLQTGRIAHAVVLESKNEEQIDETVKEICQWAVCHCESGRPCHSCKGCTKVHNGTHPDIYRAQLFGKTEVVNIDEVRKICNDAYIRPNEAERKVYIIPNADKMQIPAQNALLKIIEEPPQNIIFLFCCESAKKLLGTILSRVTIYPLDYTYDNDEAVKEAYITAINILSHFTDTQGYPLLCSISSVQDRETAKAVMENLIDMTGNAIKYKTAGIPCSSEEQKLGEKAETAVLTGIIETLYIAIERLNSNINMNLFGAWLCSALRRRK